LVGQQEQAAEALQDQPIWVQDLLAWLEKIQQQDLTIEEWVRQVQDVFAELPGQGLPKEFWPKRQADSEVEAAQGGEKAEPQPLSDGDRVRIWEELNKPNSISDEKRSSEDLAAIATQIPASELQLLQAALDAANRIEDEGRRRLVLFAVAAQIPMSEPQLLQVILEVANSIRVEFDFTFSSEFVSTNFEGVIG
jgi:hypothetical protein